MQFLNQTPVKMKNLPILLFLFLCGSLLAQEQSIEKRTSSKIVAVTVYQEGAQIQRTASAQLALGKTELVITGLSANIDPASLQVTADKAIRLLSVSHRFAYEQNDSQPEALENLQNEQVRLQDLMLQNTNAKEVLNQEKTMILANQLIGGEDNGVKITELAAAADFWRNRLGDISKRLFELELETRTLKKESSKTALQIQELGGKSGERFSEVVLQIQAKNSTQAKFKLNYFSAYAGWEPTYDVRVTDIDQDLSLTTYGRIFQTTGRDWNEVDLTLSSGNPRTQQSKPILEPWYLSFRSNYGERKSSYSKSSMAQNPHLNRPYNASVRTVQGIVTDEDGVGLPFATVLVIGANVGAQTDMDGRYELQIPPGGFTQLAYSYVGFQSITANISAYTMNVVMPDDNVMLSEVVVTSSKSSISSGEAAVQYENLELQLPPDVESGDMVLNKEFKITQKYSIASTGKRYDVQLEEEKIPVDYQYHCVPKLDPGVFLVASIPNWNEYELMAGKANIYFDRTFIGKTFIDVQAVEDTVVISLGRDDRVTVERTKVKDQSKKQWLGGKKKITKAWTIKVRNNKTKDIDLFIEDQIPVSQDKAIEVELQEKSGASLFEDIGALIWELKIAAGSTEERQFKYEIKHPKRRVVK